MAKNFIFVLTEGDHDAAFIYRILKANGMTTNHKIAIKNYPFPLNELIKNGISSVPIEELNMETTRSRFLPSYIMQKDDNIVSIYRVGSDSKDKIRIDFIKTINALNIDDPDADAIQVMKDTQISILFFFDADDGGVEKRMTPIKTELKKAFPSATNIDDLKNKEILFVLIFILSFKKH